MENIAEDILTIIIGYRKYKSQFYGLGKKIKIARNNCFRISEMVKLTTKIDSSISNGNIFYNLKFPIPIM